MRSPSRNATAGLSRLANRLPVSRWTSAIASCGDGNLTVIHEDSPDKYTVVENVPTKKSARTMGLDLKTHNIFLPAADFDPPAPGERRGKMKPGSFVLLVVGK